MRFDLSQIGSRRHSRAAYAETVDLGQGRIPPSAYVVSVFYATEALWERFVSSGIDIDKPIPALDLGLGYPHVSYVYVVQNKTGLAPADQRAGCSGVALRADQRCRLRLSGSD